MSAIAQKGGEQYPFRPREEVERIDGMFPQGRRERIARDRLAIRRSRFRQITTRSKKRLADLMNLPFVRSVRQTSTRVALYNLNI